MTNETAHITQDTTRDTTRDAESDRSDRGVGRRHLGWLAVLAIGLVALAIIDGPARHALDRWGWVDRDRPFTELYFPDHLALPDTVRSGAALPFDFSVRNREGSARTYGWEITLAPAGAPDASALAATVASGELRLAADEARVVRVEPLVELPAGDAIVTVALTGRDETIHFPIVVEAAVAGEATTP